MTTSSATASCRAAPTRLEALWPHGPEGLVELDWSGSPAPVPKVREAAGPPRLLPFAGAGEAGKTVVAMIPESELSADEDGFEISVPAWRARRLRAHLAGLIASGTAAHAAGEKRSAPPETAHRAEVRCWLGGWDQAHAADVSPAPGRPTEKQIARIARWQAGAGRLRPADGARRREIMESVADELLSGKPLAFGAIAAAHRETVRLCRAAGLPGPKASRYRRWLKLSGRAPGPTAS